VKRPLLVYRGCGMGTFPAGWEHINFPPSDGSSKGLGGKLVTPAFQITAQIQRRTLLASDRPGGVSPIRCRVRHRRRRRSSLLDAGSCGRAKHTEMQPRLPASKRGAAGRDPTPVASAAARGVSKVGAVGPHAPRGGLNGPHFLWREPAFRAAPPTCGRSPIRAPHPPAAALRLAQRNRPPRRLKHQLRREVFARGEAASA